MIDPREKSIYARIFDAVVFLAIMYLMWQYLKGLADKSQRLIGERRWWLMPMLMFEWLLLGAPCLFVVGGMFFVTVGMFGMATLFPTALAIGAAMHGDTGAAVGLLIAQPLVLLAVGGFLYEDIRKHAPGGDHATWLETTYWQMGILCLCGIGMYLMQLV